MKHPIFASILRTRLSVWLITALVVPASPVMAQRQRSCGTPLAISQAAVAHPKRYELYRQNLTKQISPTRARQYERGTAIAVIPVVVHIVLTDPSQVTDAQVQSQIDVLNTDYAADNADSVNIPEVWKSLFGNMRIQFCLARRTPGGDPTDGIDRVATGVQSFSEDSAASRVKHRATGGADTWDPTQYLNIWICNLQDDILGIGTPPGLYPADEDGVVVQYTAFGTVGNLMSQYNKGRTCTHEVGHYFNLLHPWGDGDGSCSPGDYVGDTPPQSAPVYNCQTFPYLKDPCSPSQPGVMFMNFMGYADDDCMDLFTTGQVARAQQALLTAHASLLSSKGCEPVILRDLDARLMDITRPQGKICTGGLTPTVTLKNMGKTTLSSLQVTYRIDAQPPRTYQWTGSLPSLDTVTVTLPAATIDTGAHQLTIYASDPNGGSDQQTANDTVAGTFHLDRLGILPFQEGFEQGTFPPQGWTLSNPDGSYTWELTTDAAYSGHHAAVMKNLDYEQNGPTDELISPVFDLKGSDSAFLSFELAAAVWSDPRGSNDLWDTLEVLISRDCGATGTLLYRKGGPGLITTPNAVRGEFVPKTSEWRRDSINLTPYVDGGPFRIIFRNITNFENNIYLDNINLVTRPTNPILKEKKILVVPNPSGGIVQVQFLGIPEGLKDVSVYNSIGQLIARKTPADINGQNRIEFNLTNEPNDVYFVRVSYTDHQITKKIVKLK